MSYYHYQQYHHANDMSYYTPHTQVALSRPSLLYVNLFLQDMSSYVAVQGTPRKDNSFVFGLTPKEVRYLRVGGLLNTISDYVLRLVLMCLPQV